MSHFESAILFVLRNEGGYSNHHNDHGGATNYGISTRFLKLVKKDLNADGHINAQDVVSLTKDKAVDLYKEHFWDHYKLDNIRDVHIATKALDLFVNMRGTNAAKIIQRACNKMGSTLAVDGLLGHYSFCAVNEHASFTGNKARFMGFIREEQAEFYRAIVKRDKTQRVFLKGWLARAER